MARPSPKRRRSNGERESVLAFVLALKARLAEADGQPDMSWAEFSRRTGVTYFSLMDWKQGRSSPDAYNLLVMLQAVGVLGEGFEVPKKPIEVAEELVRRLDGGETIAQRDLERVAAQADRAIAGYQRLVDRLRGRASRSGQQSP